MTARATRRAVDIIDEHANSIIFVMFAVMLITAVFAAIGWDKARKAEMRVTTVEANLAAEQLGKRIADVSTCFLQAHTRPRLVVILRGISLELENDPRQALLELIDEYEAETPTRKSCAELAREKGINPRPYLRNPPGQPREET